MANQYLFYTIICLLVACSPTKHPSWRPEDPDHEYVQFGTGGGFAGIETQFILRDDGYLFQKSMKDSTAVYYGRINSKQADLQITKSQAICTIDDSRLLIGNTYKYISVTTNTENCRKAWTNETSSPSKNLESLYESLSKNFIREK